MCYEIINDIIYDMQAKLLPAHDMEDSRAFTRSERILLDHQKLKRMSAVDLRDLIRDVLHNPEFNASEVDHYMHCLLYTSPSPRDRQKSRMPSSA